MLHLFHCTIPSYCGYCFASGIWKNCHIGPNY